MGCAFYASLTLSLPAHMLVGCAGERMTEKLRSDTFRAFMRQEIGFFDEELHNPRILAGRLATDASLVHQGTTQVERSTLSLSLSRARAPPLCHSLFSSYLPYFS